MKNLLKEPVLLLGALGALVGLGFVSNQSAEVNAQGSVKWCDYQVSEDPEKDGCKVPITFTSCICEDQC